MIAVKNNVFHLAANELGYVFKISRRGLAEHLHFGRRLKDPVGDEDALSMKRLAPRPGEASLSLRAWDEILQDLPLEFTSEGMGDFRTPFISIEGGRSSTLDLRFRHSAIGKGIARMKTAYPQALAGEEEAQHLVLDFEDETSGIRLTLVYTIFPGYDVITRRSVLFNGSKEAIRIKELASLQLDLFTADWDLLLTGGPAGRENRGRWQRLPQVRLVNETRTGFSGRTSSTAYLSNGRDCIATGLLWPGDHRSSYEVTEYGKTHIICGLNYDLIHPVVQPGGSFETPEAFLTWAPSQDEACWRLQDWIAGCIMRGIWKDRLRPVTFNTRLSMGLEIKEGRLLDEVKLAGQLGFELFCLDDGWFGVRQDKNDSLGDWSANPMKLPDGLASVSKAAHLAGMLFGIWISPELVSAQSRLFSQHPDWAVKDPRKKNPPDQGGAFLLDLTRDKVYEEVLSVITDLVERTQVDALRWDMGCQMLDIWTSPDGADPGTWRLEYMLAFLRLQRALSLRFPNLLIENVSTGSPRFDASMLNSSALLAAGSSTDAFEQLDSIIGASRLVPPSAVSTTVAERRWNLEGRYSSLSTAFNIAAFGALSYSLELKSLDPRERKAIAAQISFYKTHRTVLQFGRRRLLCDGRRVMLSATSGDKEEILVLLAQRTMRSNGEDDILRLEDVDEDAIYSVSRREEASELTSPDDYFKAPPLEEEAYRVHGDTLRHAGLRLIEPYLGGAYDDAMRVMGDHSSRLYVIRRIG